MKEININKIILFISLVIFVILSFAPCFIRTSYPLMIAVTDDSTARDVLITTLDYNPMFCLFLSLIEIILLLPKHFVFRILGLLLNLTKLIRPLLEYCIIVCLDEITTDLYAEYTLSPGFYLIIIIGILISILYITDFICSIKNRKKNISSCSDSTTQLSK